MRTLNGIPWALLLSTLLVGGCPAPDEPARGPSGDDGKDGEDGPPGPPGPTPEPEPEPEPVTAPSCPDVERPPGLGGIVDADLSLEAAQRWRDFRAAREQERMREAAMPERVQATYRVEQEWIDDGCIPTEHIVDVGRGLFMRNFTLAEGLGNDLAGVAGTKAAARPRPNQRRFQRGDEYGNFGGPDASSCQNCHWKGGVPGAGDRADNTFMLGDGDDIRTHDSRNPPSLFGVGWTELVARELNAQLAAQAAALVVDAADAGEDRVISLEASDVDFGVLRATVDEDGTATLDTSGVIGIDADLLVKPFGWKGIFPDIRSFVLGSAHLHLGMQGEELVAGVRDGRIEGLYVGEGEDIEDPDNDGVRRELTEGQITAMVLYLATLDMPQMRVPPEPEFALRWQDGAALFEDLGCAGCHVPLMPVRDSVYRTTPMLSENVVSVDLSLVGAKPRPATDNEGVWWVPLFSDLKRHDMGAHLAGGHVEHGVPRDRYLTRRLTALASSGPYLHDASAATFDEAIAMHGGEGSEALVPSQAYFALTANERASIRVFLLSLARAPTVHIR